MELVSSNKSFGGYQKVFKHHSETLGCSMNFGVYLPPGDGPCPVIYYLSGLTCSEKNCIEKGQFQQKAAELGIAVVLPDTSPRGLDIPGENDSWDFGTGAGFYLDATKEPYAKNYKMYSYVTKELPSVLSGITRLNLEKSSITGHSMGGHGALTIFLKNSKKYKSVSAFAPICNPLNCAWGEKAFSGYLENGLKEGREYDATELVKDYSGENIEILIDQGKADCFYPDQLKSESIAKAASDKDNVIVNLRLHEDYDHSYYFISTFMNDHLEFHAKYLC